MQLLVVHVKLGKSMLPVYLPWRGSLSPVNDLNKLTNYCQERNVALVARCEANEHHVVWGSSDINLRKMDLQEFMFTTDLGYSKCRENPTFRDASRAEVRLDARDARLIG